jgi:cephalosporin hydroxylase
MVINWIGEKYKPKRILEIGTRTGGSLISLLSPYVILEGLEIYCFDLWREYYKTTFIKKVPIIRRLTKFIPENLHLKLSIKKVNKNLEIFKIPTENINYITGDSKVTIPDFFSDHPKKKFDYILVDGAHDKESALMDLLNIGSHVSMGGFIVFDDIGPESYQLIDVWEKFKEKFNNQFYFYEYYHRKGVAWAIRK